LVAGEATVDAGAKDVERRVARMIEPSVDAMGYELVRVRLTGRGTQTLQVMAERRDRRDMSVDDCAEISRQISALLDVEDPIRGAYDLEVSSPGIDRPLVRLADFERFAGDEARVETARAIDGRKRFRGRLAGVSGEAVLLRCEGAEARIPFQDVVRAKLILTDELIAKTTGKQDG
jgi:ribosome maturation factor RimP